VAIIKETIEKLRKKRERNSAEIESTLVRQEAVPADKDKIGWVSPNYTMSRSVQLVPDTIASNRCVGFFPGASEVEYYRLLRTQILQRAKEKGGNTIMVTSSIPGEGKTLTAINLAFTFAKEFKQTALLVDCDLRQQKIHEYLGLQSDRGLIDYLLNDRPVSDLMIWPGIEKLTLVSGGRAAAGSSELLGSPRMKDLVEDMKSRYSERFVIFDVPPLLSTADALAFAPFVDHILVVVRAGRTSIRDVNKALQLLPKEKVLGLALNGQKFAPKMYP
jgi:protein-tyrosine kinase